MFCPECVQCYIGIVPFRSRHFQERVLRDEDRHVAFATVNSSHMMSGYDPRGEAQSANHFKPKCARCQNVGKSLSIRIILIYLEDAFICHIYITVQSCFFPTHLSWLGSRSQSTVSAMSQLNKAKVNFIVNSAVCTEHVED